MRYVIAEDQATWVRSFYAVEVPDGCDAGDAQEKFEDGRCEYLGCTLNSNVDHVSSEIASVEQTDAMPFMSHPADQPEENADDRCPVGSLDPNNV